jgi:hypothetical protein
MLMRYADGAPNGAEHANFLNKGVFMKKQLFLLILTVLVLSSCTITKATTIFDEKLPVEKTSWILTSQGEIIAYNGINVKWKQSGLSLNVVSIPAGNTLLEMNIKTEYGYNTFYTASNVLFRYNFLPQKYYDFGFIFKDGKYGFNVYAWDFGEKLGYNRKEHFVEFVPFVNELKFR